MCSYDTPETPTIPQAPIEPAQEKDVRVGRDSDKDILKAKQRGIEAFLLPIIGGQNK